MLNHLADRPAPRGAAGDPKGVELLPPLFANIANSRTKALNREVIPEAVAYDSSRNDLLRLYICGSLFEADYILLHLVRYDQLWFR